MSSQRQRGTAAGGYIRLNKYLAGAGICSRREADRLMEEGQVTVDDVPAEPGMMVTGREKIKVGDRIVRGTDRKVVVAFYKPVGVTTTAHDPHAAVTLEEVFKYPFRLTYAGRLDRDSEGLLLMTNDGDLIEAMMRGANGHEKEYVVRTRSRISDEQLHRMEKGIWLKDLEAKTRPCRIDRLGEYTFRIILTQGLNRQIRRMCRAVGADIKSLKRVRVLNVTLKGLKPGMQREITGDELQGLYQAAGLQQH
jgi:23S rRNA pseudouridine2604 synthase